MKDNKEMDRSLKLIAKSSIIMFLGILFAKILNYAYRITIARNLGPEVFGLFVLAISIVGFITAISSLGFPEGLVRYIAIFRGKKEDNKIRYLFKSSLLIMILCGFIGGLFLFIFAEPISMILFHNTKLINFLMVFAFVIPLILVYNVLSSTLRAFEEISWYSFIENILQNIIKLSALLLFIALGLEINSVIYSYLLGVIAVLLASYAVLKYKSPLLFKKEELEKREKTKIKKNFLKYSIPLMFFGVISGFLVLTDSSVIGYFLNAAQVGFHNAAMSIALLLLVQPLLFSKLFLPLITKEYGKNNLSLIEELGKQVQKWIFIINLPALLIMLIFPGAIINILFGEQYLVAENALRFLAVGIFILSIGSSVSENLIYMVGRSKTILYNTLFISIVNLILNIILVPRYGINGAAFSTMIVCIFLSLITLLQVRSYLSITLIGGSLVRIMLASLIPAFILIILTRMFYITAVNLIIFGSFFLLAYLFMIVISNCLDKNDFLILNSIKSKIIQTFSLF